MLVEGIAFESTGADAQEGDSVAVFRVKVRVDFEDESSELDRKSVV